MEPAIEVENLGKKYAIAHEAERGHATLVETLSKGSRRLVQRMLGHKIPPTAFIENFWALKNLSFKIDGGDRLGIIGKNGAGKSTLLKILSRITDPSEGQIRIRGRLSSLLEVGTGFHPELTGRENIYLNGAILGMSSQEIRKQFDRIVDFAEVEKFLDTPVKRYSSGMYTRLGFAIAAHLDPDLLIVDEVLAVGDQAFQEKCLKKLNELGRGGRTVLFVSHDVGNILSLCNKGLWLEKGELQYFGAIETCVSNYMKSLKNRPLTWQGRLGDEHIEFTHFKLSGGSSTEFFYQHESPLLTLEYEVHKTDPDLLFGFSILNQRNQTIARSHTADDPENMAKYTTTGKHCVSFALPCALFNEGEYYIRLECVIHNKKAIIQDELYLKFPVFASKKNTRYAHLAERGGIVLGTAWQRGGSNG